MLYTICNETDSITKRNRVYFYCFTDHRFYEAWYDEFGKAAHISQSLLMSLSGAFASGAELFFRSLDIRFFSFTNLFCLFLIVAVTSVLYHFQSSRTERFLRSEKKETELSGPKKEHVMKLSRRQKMAYCFALLIALVYMLLGEFFLIHDPDDTGRGILLIVISVFIITIAFCLIQPIGTIRFKMEQKEMKG